MPKFESSSGLGQDSFFTIRISKRTAVEIIVVAGIILAAILWRQYEKQSQPALADQHTSESGSPAPTSAAHVVASPPPRRQSASGEISDAKNYTPEFGADDLSDSPPQNNSGQALVDPSVSSAAPEYAYRQEYAPNEPPPSYPAPDAYEPENNRAEPRSRDHSDEPAADRPSGRTPDVPSDPINVNGAGATYPNVLYQKWFSEYHAAHANVQINYQAIGSGGGIKQLQSRTVDFAASDGAMNNEQLAQTPFKVAQIPTVLNAILITYNVPGVNQTLQFSPDVLADVFLGRIQYWNDPLIQRDNPRIPLPHAEIRVIHRSDAGATTYIFTDYLSKISPEWSQTVHSGTAVNWPVGLGGKGNEGMMGLIKQTEGSIGYVDFIYAFANHLPVGRVQNASGQFIAPNMESVKDAASSGIDAAGNFRVSITNAPGTTAYPIAGFTWLLVPQEWSDASKKKTFVAFIDWAIDRGETMAPELGYVPLPKEFSARIKQKLRGM
jgi:phosphate transport system substrate-binding protein